MSTIYLYDIAEGKWYQQNATGQVPENRRKFCAGATWASDQSSYNIYLYGGAGFAENATGFDDVYILTLPSFTWIKWYPEVPGPGNPHHSLTCNVIDNAQMLIIGGTFPATDACDAPDVWGTHNLDLGQNNPEHAKWNLFNPSLTSYNVPSEIISVVGGGSTGGATATAPAGGWDNRDLPVYFQQQATYAARTPTRALPTAGSTPDGRKSNKGAIIGSAVGGVIALLLLLGLTILCCKRRGRRRRPSDTPDMTQSRERPPSELNVRNNAIEPDTPSPSPPSTHLPAYLEQKPSPPPITTTHPAAREPQNPASPVHSYSYTATPPPMVGSAQPQYQHQQPQSPAHHTSSLFTQFATPLQSPTAAYQHPAHSPPFQQQPYFPPPPTREYPQAQSEQDAGTYEMSAVRSPKATVKKKKTWGD
jgi:hypothetical protein